jgi:hypothetical protein
MKLYHTKCGTELKPESYDTAEGTPVEYSCSECREKGVAVSRIMNEVDGKEYAELNKLAKDPAA